MNKAVYEPIQQNAAKHFNSWLGWIVMNVRLQQTVTNFYSSDPEVLSEAKCSFHLLWLLFACIHLSVLMVSED